MKATVAPAIEHSSSSQALHDQNKGNSAFFGPAAENETPFFAPRLQTKLTIGSPGDKYEQEADSVADRVVQRLSNLQAAAPAVQRKCTDCEEKEKLQRKEEEEPEAPEVMRKETEEEEAPPVQAKEKEEEEKTGIMRQAGPEEEEPLQTKATPDGAASPSPSLESRLSSAKGSGAALDKNTRQPMEAAFGQDFSRVRIHTNSGAAQMNRELNARAFTHGRDIYFNAGEYSPGSTEGRRLLAHELVHVGQQGGVRNKIIQQKAKSPASQYSLTIFVDAAGYRYGSPESLAKSMGKQAGKGHNQVGHTWVSLEDKSTGLIESGGHSGETGNASKNPSISDSAFLTYSGGVSKLVTMNPTDPSPMASLPEADPKNPIRWLKYIYEDGHWAPGTGGHTNISKQKTWDLTKSQFDAAKSKIDALKAAGGANLKMYGLTGKQCTSTAADIAKEAGIMLDPFVQMTFPSTIKLSGYTLRLWTDPAHKTIRFALPDKMKDII